MTSDGDDTFNVGRTSNFITDLMREDFGAAIGIQVLRRLASAWAWRQNWTSLQRVKWAKLMDHSLQTSSEYNILDHPMYDGDEEGEDIPLKVFSDLDTAQKDNAKLKDDLKKIKEAIKAAVEALNKAI